MSGDGGTGLQLEGWVELHGHVKTSQIIMYTHSVQGVSEKRSQVALRW